MLKREAKCHVSESDSTYKFTYKGSKVQKSFEAPEDSFKGKNGGMLQTNSLQYVGRSGFQGMLHFSSFKSNLTTLY